MKFYVLHIIPSLASKFKLRTVFVQTRLEEMTNFEDREASLVFS
jgi:hypothetical protein